MENILLMTVSQTTQQLKQKYSDVIHCQFHARHILNSTRLKWVSQKDVFTSMYCFKSRSKYSKTNVRLVWVCIISCKVTIFACLSPRSRETWNKNWTVNFHVTRVSHTFYLPSRIAVHGAPSSNSRRISFSATILLVSLDLPLNTVA